MISSKEGSRPQLRAALDYCRDDVLIVWRLDRLGRLIKELIELANVSKDRVVAIRSLQESLGTTTVGGRLIFHVFGALAEFEWEIILERTMAGLESVRARKRHGGIDENKAKLARRLQREGEHSVEEICSILGVGHSTLYRYLGEDSQGLGERGRS